MADPIDTDVSENFTLTVTENDREEFKRLDVYLTEKLPFSRSTIKRMFGNCRIY